MEEELFSLFQTAARLPHQPHLFLPQLHLAFSSSPPLHPLLWDQLASRRIPLAPVLQSLVAAMEAGGRLALLAADAYLAMLRAPACPLYSLFSQLAFQVLIRCVRSSCKPVIVGQQTHESGAGVERPRKGRGRGKGGKRGSRKHREAIEETGLVEETPPFEGSCASGEISTATATATASTQEILNLLENLQATLSVLHLKEHQESLQSLMELLAELPHLFSEMQGEDDGLGDSNPRGSRPRKMAPRASSSPLSASRLAFSMMQMILDPGHGDPQNTAVILLKLLTPSILLTRPGGSSYQRGQIRAQALQFVTGDILASKNLSLRTVVVALPRYLAFKAPEKTDARAQAVEAVMAVVKALAPQEQRKFGHFVAKLSRGKPRHRLFAVDLAVALLNGLSNPLGLDKEADEAEENFDSSEPGNPVEYFEESPDNANGASISGNEDGAGAITELEESDGKENEDGGSAGASHPPNERSNPSSGSVANQWWGVACLEALLHRCSDKAPAIRARALANLAQALELLSTDIRNRAVLQQLLGFGNASAPPQGMQAQSSPLLDSWQTPGHGSPTLGGQTPSPEPSAQGPGASPLTPGAGHGDLGTLLRRRCLDEKVAVRKATLVLMMKSASLLGKPPDETILQAMGAACADSMLSIRKAALAALSEVLRKFPADKRVVSEWLQSALPLIMDNESSIQEECLIFFEELALDRVASVATIRLPSCRARSSRKMVIEETDIDKNTEQELERMIAPGILLLLKGMADGANVVSCVKRTCTILGKKKRLRAGVALALQNIITASKMLWSFSTGSSCLQGWTAPSGAWLLLAEVSAFVPKAIGWEFLRNHWQFLEKQDSFPRQEFSSDPERCFDSTDDSVFMQSTSWAADRVHLLQTISSVAIELPPDAAADLAAELLERLEAFNMHPTEVGAHVKALTVLCNRKATSSEEGDQLVTVWVEELLKKAEDILQAYVSTCSKVEQSQTHNRFQTPKPGKSRRKATGSSQQTGNNLDSSSEGIDPSARIITAIFTVGALVLVCPTAKLGHLVTLLQALVTSKNAKLKIIREEEGPLVHEDVAPGVYAQSWVTLGKICLANYDLAKRCIPLFVQELEKTDSAAVRNNIMVAMTDFCIRYTALVDGYIQKLTKSLRDPCELVRRQAFVLLARLLQRDYVKWRGTLFHRFLLALVDESAKICNMANFLFGSILRTKAPLLAYNSFVEAIFVLNDCHAHVGHSEMLQVSESERKLFSLRGSGEAVAEKRMHIYTALLKQMAPEHLLATSAKLCAEILAAAADGLLDVNEPSVQCVLEDALKILASKEMRIGGHRGVTPDHLDMEEEGAAASFAAAKGRVVTQLAKKNLVQNAIPIFIELKRLLESRNSPLTGMLMECMRVMLKEYKSEIEEILVADKQLQKEIMYDMQKHEATKARAKVAAAAAVVAGPSNSGLRQRDGLAINQAEQPFASRAAEKSPGVQFPEKTPRSHKEKGRGVPSAGFDGKENMDPQEDSLIHSQPLQPSSKTLAGSCIKRKTFVSPVQKFGAAQSSHVKWLDQTPGFQHGAAHIPNCSNATGSVAARSKANTSKENPAYASNGENPSREPEGRASLLSSANGNVLRKQKIASAVGDVAAAATVAAVLREVATGSSTPLHYMSIPRLNSCVASTAKKASFQLQDSSTGLAGLSESETKASLESVRRRQSFSSIAEPCGVPLSDG